MSIGQGELLVTPIQMANFTAAIANRGFFRKPHFKKTHLEHGFEEPIFTFAPAIGISEIIKLPVDFSEMFNNVFIVTSLYGRSIFLVRLNTKPFRVTFAEKIFLNLKDADGQIECYYCGKSFIHKSKFKRKK